ncbi:MAG: hypothetical protein R6X22_10960 [Gemmatimonadota bacterium]
MRGRVRPLSRGDSVKRWGAVLVFVLAVGACTGPEGPSEEEFEPFAEAALLWVQADESRIQILLPLDVKAESRNAAWIVDGATRGLYRFSPPAGDYRAMGALDFPPEEIEKPARVAVSRQYGLFVYDEELRLVQLFTPDGVPVRDFAPDSPPSRLELTTRPIGLAMAGIDATADSLPRLKVVRTDLRGLSRDTLLFPGSHGPEALWEAIAIGGQVALDASAGGMWALARAVPDTAFELSGTPGDRKRVLRPEDEEAFGILADLERGILWVIRHDPETSGTLRYAAYDLELPGTATADEAFRGERTTPPEFQPRAAVDGVVIGIRMDGGLQKLAAYDMRVPARGR